jgi:quinol monooxygenase YgiN
MIRRIVRLEFDPDRVEEFKTFFAQNRHLISAFPGCISLDLFADADNGNVYYSFSIWENKEALEKYRDSETFKTLWTFAKARFSAKPQAFSLISF